MSLRNAVQAVIDEMNSYRTQIPPDLPEWQAGLYIEWSKKGRELTALKCEAELRDAAEMLRPWLT